MSQDVTSVQPRETIVILPNGTAAYAVVMRGGGYTKGTPLPPFGGGSNRGCFRFKAEYGDFLQCCTWDGVSEGPLLVKVANVASGGTAYAVNDTFQIAGGTLASGGTAATGKVLAVGGSGNITSAMVVNKGSYSVAPSSPNSVSTLTGAGSGATMTLVVNNYVFIAKPWKLRRSVTTATIYTTVWSYTFSGSYGTSAPVLRTCTASGAPTLTEAISPPYLPNDTIYADTFVDAADYNLESSTTTQYDTVVLIDVNEDGRAWANQT